MAPDAPITREEAMTVVARALELDYDSYSKTDLSKFSDRNKISNWALPYVRAMIGADYIHGRTKGLEPLDNITRAEFAQIFANIIGSYITVKGTYDKDIKGSVLIRTDDVTLKDMTVDGDLIVGCGAADGKIVLDNVTVKGRLLVWGGGTKAVYCLSLIHIFKERFRQLTQMHVAYVLDSLRTTTTPVSYTHLFPAEHRIDRGEPFAVAAGLHLRLAVADEAERNFRVRQRLLLHHRRDG